MKGIGFGKQWASLLWHAMSTTGNGYHRPSLQRDPLVLDQRRDKIGVANKHRRYAQRYSNAGSMRTGKKANSRTRWA